MKTIKGPSLHLAQFSDAVAPFNSLPAIAEWAAGVGFKALQIPAWDQRFFDAETAAASQDYCDEVTGTLAAHGLVVSELTTHIFGQSLACIPPTTRWSTSLRPSKRAAILRPGRPGQSRGC